MHIYEVLLMTLTLHLAWRTICFFVSCALFSLLSRPFWTSCTAPPARWECLRLESTLKLVRRKGPCGAYATHFVVLGVKITCFIFYVIDLMIQEFIEL